MKQTHPSLACLLLILGVVIIGFTAIFVKWAEAPGTVTAFYRMALASAATAPFFLIHLRKSEWRLPRKGMLFAMAGGLCFGTDIAFWMTGIMMGEATTPTLMANTAPVWVGLSAWLLLKEKQNLRFWIGMLLAFAGVTLILSQNFIRSFHMGLGASLGLVSALFYSGFHLFSQKGRQHLNTLSYFWIFTTSGAVILLLINMILSQPLTGYGTQTIWNFIGIALIGHVGGWLCIGYAQGYLPASLIAPSVLGQPVVTAILAHFFFGDTFSGLQIIGGAIVLAGISAVHHHR